MFRILLLISLGVFLGGVAVLASIDRTPAPTYSSIASTTTCPTIVPNDPAILTRPSVVHRPIDIQSVDRALAHGSEFEKKRALFELAGVADSASLQNLIFDASQLGESKDRREALSILFDRLTELDPRSALALAQLDTIASNEFILQRVWQLWSADDLESALQESARLPNAFDRAVAAQAMFSAYGHLGNATIQRISTVTGVSPNAENRKRYFYRLADESPAGAFHYVNEMESAHKQRQAIIHLARFLVQQDGGRAAGYADLLAAPDHRNQYLAIVIGKIAEVDPQSAVTTLSSVDSAEQRYELHDQIFGQVARRDVHLAKQLADQLVDTRTRDLAYYRIIQHHARHDPVEAAGWAALITNQQVRQYAQRQVKWATERYSH